MKMKFFHVFVFTILVFGPIQVSLPIANQYSYNNINPKRIHCALDKLDVRPVNGFFD